MDAAECKHEVVFANLCAACGRDLSSCVIEGKGAGRRGRSPPVVEAPGGSQLGGAPAAGSEGRRRPGFLTNSTELHVTAGALADFEEAERRRRVDARRLVVVLDIDHTLLQSGMQRQFDGLGPEQRARPVHRIAPSTAGAGMERGFVVSPRPHLAEFLTQMCEISDLYLYTHGTTPYAEAIVEAIDPEHQYFGSPARLFTRDNTPKGLKSLREIFPNDTSLVVVVDDRDEVWPGTIRNAQLIKILPYLFFGLDARSAISLEGYVASWQPQEGGTKRKLCNVNLGNNGTGNCNALDVDTQGAGLDVDPRLRAPGGAADLDTQLLFVARTLRRLHRVVLGVPGDEGSAHIAHAGDASKSDVAPVGFTGSVSRALPVLRRRTLHGCVVCLTGVSGSSMELTSHPVAWWCTELGATVLQDLCPEATHLVAARRDTEKWHQGIRRAATDAYFHVVHPGWVLRALATWERPDETFFKSPVEGPWPSFLDVWSIALGPPDDAAACIDGDLKAIAAAETWPLTLYVTSPNCQQICAGRFDLVSDLSGPKRAVWRSTSAERWLYSSNGGLWTIGGKKAAKKNFMCAAGFVFQATPHGGTMPDEASGGWRCWDDEAKAWRDDPDILVSQEEGPSMRADEGGETGPEENCSGPPGGRGADSENPDLEEQLMHDLGDDLDLFEEADDAAGHAAQPPEKARKVDEASGHLVQPPAEAEHNAPATASGAPSADAEEQIMLDLAGDLCQEQFIG